ncbi:unnamed protein product, partial [Strongylus vulgaris]
MDPKKLFAHDKMNKYIFAYNLCSKLLSVWAADETHEGSHGWLDEIVHREQGLSRKEQLILTNPVREND